MTHLPLQSLHAAHGRPYYSLHSGEAELAGQQPVLALHHVANREARKAHARLLRAVGRRGREPVGDRIGGNNEIACRIERLARPDQEIEPVVVTRQRDADQHCVRLLAIQLAVRRVGLAVVPDHLAGLQFQIAQLRHAVLRLDLSLRHWRMSKATHAAYTQRRDAENAEGAETYKFVRCGVGDLAKVGRVLRFSTCRFIVAVSVRLLRVLCQALPATSFSLQLPCFSSAPSAPSAFSAPLRWV